jgi:hypothetical protein
MTPIQPTASVSRHPDKLLLYQKSLAVPPKFIIKETIIHFPPDFRSSFPRSCGPNPAAQYCRLDKQVLFIEDNNASNVNFIH